jgi:hypothetical protein
MYVDKAAFFLALTTLAAGGVGGYATARSGLLDRLASPGAAELQPASSPSPQAPASSEAIVEHATPACDDQVGSPAACPPPGYSADEGGCESVPTNRCEDFKRTMKPRVAERAVACLSALTPGQRCDPNQVNACAHVALMSACPTDDTDDLAPRCEAILQSCAASAFAPTKRDCLATLVGMSGPGRDRVVSCMTSHCKDKGLVGCEVAAAMH